MNDEASWVAKIDELMERYRKAAREGQWAEAGKALEALDAELKKR